MIKFFHKIHKSTLVKSRDDYIANLCVNKRVLHVGCVDAGMTDDRIQKGKLLHQKLIQIASYAVGVDVNEEGIEKLKQQGMKDLYLVAPGGASPTAEKFDVVLAGEVLEHVSNAGDFIEQYLDNLNSEGMLLITVPNAFCLTTFLRLIKNIETVHEDHVCYYSYVTIKRLLSRYKLTAQSICFYFHLRGRRIDKIMKKPLELVVSIWPQFGEGIIVCAKKNK